VAAIHVPVLLRETLELLAVRSGGLYVDGTVGLAGHAEAILQASGPDGRLYGVDRDAEALALARERLGAYGARVRLEQVDYRELPERLGVERPDGVLLDLGVSSLQLDSPERGFGFAQDGPLDMRMDRSRGESAAALVARLDERELADVVWRYGEERASRRIARALVAARARAPITTTGELATIVRRAAGRSRRRGLDPATLTFQALRIAVNRELERLAASLAALAARLAPGGRLAVIAFHSLEDREVKHTFRSLGGEGLRVLTRKPVRPTPAEVALNPRARSARLRAVLREAA